MESIASLQNRWMLFYVLTEMDKFEKTQPMIFDQLVTDRGWIDIWKYVSNSIKSLLFTHRISKFSSEYG